MKSHGNDVASTETAESIETNSYVKEGLKQNLSSNSLKPELVISLAGTGSEESVSEESTDATSDKQKTYNRDSGFHTMTRHPDNKETNTTMSSNSKVNGVTTSHSCIDDSLNSPIENDLPISPEHRGRSSPVVTKKSFKFPSRSSEGEANDLAMKLYDLEGKDKRDVAKHLSNKGDFSTKVAKKYMELFNFTNVNLDEAMRLLLKRFALLGETQERERILHHFACRYNQCNPSFLDGDLDAIHILVCAIALLNTDLHGARVGGRRRMTRKQFIMNLAGVINQGQDIPTPILKDMYRSISKHPLPWCEQKSDTPASSITKSPSLLAENKMKKSQIVLRSRSMNQPSQHKLRQLPVYPDNDGRKVGACRASKFKTIPRKQGVLWRKPVIENDGSKTAKRKRRWKLVVVALQGLELHIAKKDSHDAVKVSLHHSLAEAETSHSATSRDNVFRIILANKSVTLFQTSSREEQKMWMRAINRNAALLSAAPLSAGVGSQVKFQRPLLPSASSTLPLAKQLEEQHDRLDMLCNELDEHQQNPPSEVTKAAEKQYYTDKEDYLQHEIHKYEVYTNSLSELVTAERQYTAEQEKLSVDRRSADAQSLLSISPSEPGVGNNLSSYPSTEDTGSVGDLLDRIKPKQQRLRAVTSPLNPTSSLPNLQPQHEHLHHDSSLMRHGLRKEKNTPRPDSSLGSLPAVSETDSLTPSHPDHLVNSNLNNSNNKNVGNGAATMHSAVTKQSSFVGTSYLSKDAMRSSSMKPVSRLVDSSRSFQSLPRVKGRKERKGSSRYSYLHAVHDSAQI